jgi:hypothetical protein
MASRGDCFLALSSHLSVLPYSLPPSYRCALSTGPTNSESSSLKLRTPTAFSDRKAPFCAPSRRRPNSLPGHPEAPPPGFGYPLGGVSRPDPWKPISSSNTLGVHLSELLPLRWSKNGFAFSLRPCTFHIDRSGLHAVLRRFHPTARAVSLTAHSGRLIRNGTFPLSRVSRLSGSPSQGPTEKASSFSHSPHIVRLFSLHREENHRSQGLTSPSEWHSPKWVPPCLAFFTDDRIPPFTCRPRCGLFFRLKVPRFLTKPQRPIFAAKSGIA